MTTFTYDVHEKFTDQLQELVEEYSIRTGFKILLTHGILDEDETIHNGFNGSKGIDYALACKFLVGAVGFVDEWYGEFGGDIDKPLKPIHNKNQLEALSDFLMANFQADFDKMPPEGEGAGDFAIRLLGELKHIRTNTLKEAIGLLEGVALEKVGDSEATRRQMIESLKSLLPTKQ